MSKKLLLADDSITIQKVIGITFANEDYELTVVDNGDAALEKARSENPDLILADVFMPGKNGYELCAAVRLDPRLRGVPVLLLTGTFEPFDEDKARAAGADSWIAKPFESQALIDRVEELLARPQPQAAPATETPVAAAVAPAAPAPEAAADIWGDLAESGAAEAETVQPAEVFAETFSAAEPVTRCRGSGGARGGHLGRRLFDEEDLLAEEPLTKPLGISGFHGRRSGRRRRRRPPPKRHFSSRRRRSPRCRRLPNSGLRRRWKNSSSRMRKCSWRRRSPANRKTWKKTSCPLMSSISSRRRRLPR
jgi:CheY-like chemotaxis protein